MKYDLKWKYVRAKNALKHRLLNGGHFLQTLMCYHPIFHEEHIHSYMLKEYNTSFHVRNPLTTAMDMFRLTINGFIELTPLVMPISRPSIINA